MATNPYEAPRAEVERALAFKPRRLSRFIGIAIINLAIAITSTAIVIPLFVFLLVYNYTHDSISLPMVYIPVLIFVNTLGLVSSAIGLLVNPRWGWVLTVGYCLPGLVAVTAIFFVQGNPIYLVGAPYPAVVLALLLSSTARQAAGISRARPRRRWRRRPRPGSGVPKIDRQ